MTVFHECKFAGISVGHISSSIIVGRRTVTVEYPFREYTDYYDIGAAPRQFSEALIISGDDAHTEIARLINILESPGPYEYVHPLFGSMSVKVDRSGVEIVQRQGVVNSWSVSLSMEVAGERREVESISTSSKVTIQSNRAKVSTKQNFDQAYSTEGLGFVEILRENLATVRRAQQKINQINSKIAEPLGLLDELADVIRGYDTSIKTLHAAPGNLSTKLMGAVAAGASLLKTATKSNPAMSPIRSVRESARKSERELGNVTGVSDGSPVSSSSSLSGDSDAAKTPGILSPDSPSSILSGVASDYSDAESDKSSIPLNSTPQRAQQLNNAYALDLLVQGTSFIAMAEQSTEVAWGSYEQVQSAIDGMVELSDKVLSNPVIDDKMFQDIMNLRASLLENMRSMSRDLPRLQSYKVAMRVPAELIAFHLWGDVDSVDRIFDRNFIQHPGRVTKGVVLEVLSDY